MKKIYVGVVDYKIGNHSSVVQCLRELGFRVIISSDPEKLEQTDLLLLPGVGAFHSAMKALHEQGLVGYLQAKAMQKKPIIGICLGMQLLTDMSYEHELTSGLGLIPGRIIPLDKPNRHIGWNTLKVINDSFFIQIGDNQHFYFNHSFIYEGHSDYQVCITEHKKEFSAVIQNNNVVGVQFHPEKSQQLGKLFLKNLILRMCDA